MEREARRNITFFDLLLILSCLLLKPTVLQNRVYRDILKANSTILSNDKALADCTSAKSPFNMYFEHHFDEPSIGRRFSKMYQASGKI